MVSRRSAIAVRTASAGSQIRGFNAGSATFMRGCASGFFASLASAASAADLTATLAPSNARSPGQLAYIILAMLLVSLHAWPLILGTMFCGMEAPAMLEPEQSCRGRPERAKAHQSLIRITPQRTQPFIHY